LAGQGADLIVTSSGFSIVKWYLDCVTDSGEVAIVYSAVAGWRGISISYCSYLGASGTKTESATTMHSAAIKSEGQRILVNAPELKLSGEWTAIAAGVKQTVFESEAGSVDWDCVQPGARVRLRVGDRELVGLGYAEVLTLSVPPWQLPMSHLKWGRFVSERDNVAWIDWQGRYSFRFVVHNGERYEEAAISDSSVSVGGSDLYLDNPRPLRAGPLGQTVGLQARGLTRLFPKSMLGIEERKWRSQGRLVTPEGESRGWAIHEAIDWNL
jgi:hypothetical protein